jgi:hypothetical protein
MKLISEEMIMIGERVSVVKDKMATGATVFNGEVVDIIRKKVQKPWYMFFPPKYDTKYVVKMDSEWLANDLWHLNPDQVFRTLNKKD